MAQSLDVEGPQVQAMIRTLVQHHVAVTSTLAIFETFTPNRPPLAKQQGGVKAALDVDAWADYATTRSSIAEHADSSVWAILLKKEMQFERSFVRAGGLLLAGCDPTGYGGVLPGFGDQRGLELLVEAGFTPLEAIHIATQNGATYLGQQDHIGSIAADHTASSSSTEIPPRRSMTSRRSRSSSRTASAMTRRSCAALSLEPWASANARPV
jgi:hypothetical protein